MILRVCAADGNDSGSMLPAECVASVMGKSLMSSQHHLVDDDNLKVEEMRRSLGQIRQLGLSTPDLSFPSRH